MPRSASTEADLPGWKAGSAGAGRARGPSRPDAAGGRDQPLDQEDRECEEHERTPRLSSQTCVEDGVRPRVGPARSEERRVGKEEGEVCEDCPEERMKKEKTR